METHSLSRAGNFFLALCFQWRSIPWFLGLKLISWLLVKPLCSLCLILLSPWELLSQLKALSRTLADYVLHRYVTNSVHLLSCWPDFAKENLELRISPNWLIERLLPFYHLCSFYRLSSFLHPLNLLYVNLQSSGSSIPLPIPVRPVHSRPCNPYRN